MSISRMSPGAPIGSQAAYPMRTPTMPLSTPIPAYDSACHDRQSCATRESYYYLNNDWDDVEAPEGWDHALEDSHQ